MSKLPNGMTFFKHSLNIFLCYKMAAYFFIRKLGEFLHQIPWHVFQSSYWPNAITILLYIYVISIRVIFFWFIHCPPPISAISLKVYFSNLTVLNS